MSSNIDAAAMADIPEEKTPPVRRFPPPCWTQEETLALIEAYRERWYALRRGYLRTADWETVAAAVTSRCPDASPAKTSAQCRHKMEKLRQRYRAEKQRSLASPTGRYFSSWFFFDNMDAMENGTTVSAIRSSNHKSDEQVADMHRVTSGGGHGLKTIIDQNLLKLKISNNRNGVNVNPVNDSNASFVFNRSSNFGSRVPPPPPPPNGYYEQPNDVEFGSGAHLKNGVPLKAAKRTGRMNGFDQGGNFVINPNFDCDEGSEYNGSSNNAGDGYHHVIRNMGVSSSSRRSYGGNVEANNDFSRFSPKLGKKGVGVKRGRGDGMEEMILSIKLLGEGFMKMEKMKMEMAKEVEQMRMEMEMKRNEMILESQKQIVEAFVKVLSEVNKNKNVKTVSPES